MTSLAVGGKKGSTTLIYAGVNSSANDRGNGKNAHFRVFGLETAPSKKGQKVAATKISELSRATLFAKSEMETYQRILRLSKPFPGSAQLGAAATAFASKDEEVVVFDTAKSSSGTPNVRGRILIDKPAEDVDVIQTGKDEYLFAYCTKYDIFVKAISSETSPDSPVNITPDTTEDERAKKPVYRSIRFLSPRFLLILVNLHGRKGAVLQILRLPTKANTRASQALNRNLPARVQQATNLAVCNLSPRSSPAEEQGHAQFIIAVAGHDMSILLYAFEHRREGPVSMIAELRLLQTLNEVHPFQITGLGLSTFTPATATSSSPNVKLASISAGNTVVMHTIPLAPVNKSSPKRYVVRGSTDKSFFTFPIIASIIATIALAFFAQVIFEIRSDTPSFLNAANFVAPDVKHLIKYPLGSPKSVLSSATPIVSPASPSPAAPPHSEFTSNSFSSALDALMSQQAEKSSEDGSNPVIVLREHPADPAGQQETNGELKSSLKADLHDEAVHGPHGGKTWTELTKEERERWTRKLKDAGHWAEDFGETILKGVVFGAAGGAIGAAVGG